MADGTRKPIREVKVGDQVLATDPTTGRTEARSVTALIAGHDVKHLVAVTVDTGRGPATLTATDNHPFWDDTDYAWTDADQLTPADTLHTPTGGHIPVTATRHYDQTPSTTSPSTPSTPTTSKPAPRPSSSTTPLVNRSSKARVEDVET